MHLFHFHLYTCISFGIGLGSGGEEWVSIDKLELSELPVVDAEPNGFLGTCGDPGPLSNNECRETKSWTLLCMCKFF